MKRLICLITLVVVGAAILPSAAQATPTLTMDEAESAIWGQGVLQVGPHFSGSEISECSRQARNRIRCVVRGTFEKKSKLKTCRSRVEVVETAEIRVRILKRKCRVLNVKVLTYERARRAAAKAMDPMAFSAIYGGGYSSSSEGRNRYAFEVNWTNEKQQVCIQTAKVRLVNKKVKVNVSDVACVDQPDWPSAQD